MFVKMGGVGPNQIMGYRQAYAGEPGAVFAGYAPAGAATMPANAIVRGGDGGIPSAADDLALSGRRTDVSNPQTRTGPGVTSGNSYATGPGVVGGQFVVTDDEAARRRRAGQE